MKPRLTILTPLPPYPPLAGGTVHISNVVQQLADVYATRLYALSPDPAAVRWGPLADVCIETAAFRPTPRRTLSLDPPAVRGQYSPDLIAHLRHTWAREAPDSVQLEFTSIAQYAPLAQAAGAWVVCTAHNVAFLAQWRRTALEQSASLKLRRFAGFLSLWLYELRALRQCDLVVTHSEPDAATLRRWLPRVPVEYVPSGMDVQTHGVCFDPTAQNEVLFVGNYAHPPNVEGAIWLAREVWPLVRRAIPTAHLTLAGRGPTPQIQALAASDITVPGTLDNLQTVYAHSSAVAAPIFWGAGVRIKILEALAYGVPLVTTPLAAEGIALVDGESALFASTPAEFAAAVVRLLRDRALRERVGAAGRAVVERDYDWRQIRQRLVALYEAGRQM